MVYLLKSGVSVPAVFVSIALILLGRFLIRPLVIVLSVRWGLRAMVAIGTLLTALQYPLLAEVHGVDPALFALCAVSSISDTVYWPTYHAYFAALGDDEHRGHQISIREAIAAVVGVIAPLATGWLLFAYGPRVAFGTSAVIMALAAVPILWTPNVAVAPQAIGSFRAAVPGALLFAADGWVGGDLRSSCGRSHCSFRLARTCSASAVRSRSRRWSAPSAVFSLDVTSMPAMGNGRCGIRSFRSRRSSCCARSRWAMPCSRCLPMLPDRSPASLYAPTLMTAMYTQAKHSPCTLRFHVVADGGWDAGGASALLIAAALTALGVPLWVVILLSLVGIAGMIVMLRRYYDGAHAAKLLDAKVAAPVFLPLAVRAGRDSLRLDAGELHHLCPFLRFRREKGAEGGRAERHRRAAEIGEPRAHGGCRQRPRRPRGRSGR